MDSDNCFHLLFRCFGESGILCENPCIIVINNNVVAGLNINVGAGFKPAPTNKRHGLSEIVRAFKTFSSRYINQIRNTPGTTVWQRNY